MRLEVMRANFTRSTMPMLYCMMIVNGLSSPSLTSVAVARCFAASVADDQTLLRHLPHASIFHFVLPPSFPLITLDTQWTTSRMASSRPSRSTSLCRLQQATPSWCRSRYGVLSPVDRLWPEEGYRVCARGEGSRSGEQEWGECVVAIWSGGRALDGCHQFWRRLDS